jgi:hypothetical protein
MIFIVSPTKAKTYGYDGNSGTQRRDWIQALPPLQKVFNYFLVGVNDPEARYVDSSVLYNFTFPTIIHYLRIEMSEL